VHVDEYLSANKIGSEIKWNLSRVKFDPHEIWPEWKLIVWELCTQLLWTSSNLNVICFLCAWNVVCYRFFRFSTCPKCSQHYVWRQILYCGLLAVHPCKNNIAFANNCDQNNITTTTLAWQWLLLAEQISLCVVGPANSVANANNNLANVTSGVATSWVLTAQHRCLRPCSIE